MPRSFYNKTTSSRLGRRKKTHQKSKLGCHICKRRRVKCDEVRPRCGNCVHFGLACHYPDSNGIVTRPSEGGPLEELAQGFRQIIPVTLNSSKGLPRRGRGRPRRDWAATQESLQDNVGIPVGELVEQASSGMDSSSPPPNCPLNVDHAELLHHFIFYAGPSLAPNPQHGDPVTMFWSQNVPRLGISNSSVLYLAYSISAYHLAYLGRAETESRPRYAELARELFTVGLAKLNDELPTINYLNCGALYISVILVCYCIFAAGPTGPEDLILCHLGSTPAVRWLPLARGVRYIREKFDPSTLFSGLMEPFNDNNYQSQDARPTCICEGFLRVNWEAPLNRLHYLLSRQESNKNIYIQSFNIIASIYEATFGNDQGTYDCPPMFKRVLSFLYFVEDPFVTLLQGKDTMSMLILAYYAPLLKTMKRCWFMDGWASHILCSIRDIIEGDKAQFLVWPTQVMESI